ncbi:MAG TPA: VCBS repeat-containing protein [bacterium]|nr:VCBS repeat-containing protein [bacterium]HPJ71314.1 VCBS repeat-containing protein [bacterium]HPQ66953.1 VCBS repeat-containing protein [bacterium]
MRNLIVTAALTAGLLAGAGALYGADFDGDSRDDIAIFRPSNGLWSVRGVTRVYFGGSSDTPSPGDYNGDGIADFAVNRPSNGLWAVQGQTRVYFGNSGTDTPLIGGGGGERTYDYVVKPDDGDDLVDALESNTYKSVFIPNGTYNVSEVIDLDNVEHVVGEGNGAVISFTADNYYIHVTSDHCILENFRVNAGGSSGSNYGSVHIDQDYISLRHVTSYQSYDRGFSCTTTAEFVSFVDCLARNAASTGFSGNVNDYMARYTNCVAKNCDFGFAACRNVSSCTVDGDGNTETGFSLCHNVTGCTALDCSTAGFALSLRLSCCSAFMGGGDYGFSVCSNLSSCHVEGSASDEYYSCALVDGDSCD